MKRFLCLCALLGAAACSAPQPQPAWVYVGPPSAEERAALLAEQREIERAARRAPR